MNSCSEIAYTIINLNFDHAFNSQSIVFILNKVNDA